MHLPAARTRYVRKRSRSGRSHGRRGFTLLELVLATALSAALLILVASAINLYLLECDADRLRVEQAQLARAVLNMIAEDVRGAYVQQPQSFTSLSQAITAAAASGGNEDSEGGGGGGGGGQQGGGGGGQGGSGQQSGGGGGSGGSGGTSQSSAGGSSATAESDSIPPPGVTGLVNDVIVDIRRVPGPRERVPVQNGSPLSAVRSVRWFVREGRQVAATSLATTSMSPDEQLRVGGLVRQEVDHASRSLAQQAGKDLFADVPGQLVAPEIAAIEFRYFNGIEEFDQWDMAELQALPRAVSIHVWVRPPIVDADDAASSARSSNSLVGTQEYSLTVALPIVSETNQTDTSSGTQSSTGSGGGSR